MLCGRHDTNRDGRITEEERVKAAGRCLADQVNRAYGGWPDRLHIVGRNGKIAYAVGQSPFHFRPEQLEQAIQQELNQK